MAVFTAIASAIVGAIGISTATILGTLTWAGLATSIIAGGIAFGTAKVLGVFKPPKMQASKDPGVKIQLPPATDNKIPVFYGTMYTGGLIVDAGITNQNNTMIYVMVIGEKTDTGTYTINNIYRDDQLLNFSGANVISVTDPNATASNRVANKMRCRVYAGDAQNSANQIFPTTGKVAAQTLLSTIDSTTSYADLVYAVFELDYDPEENLLGLGSISFNITNSLSNPANVLLDYLQNNRYGAGLTSSQLDLTSFTDYYDYCSDQVSYLNASNVSVTHDRWQIDGMLSTYTPVKQNIDELCLSSSTFFTYDPKQGKFKVVPNRLATTAEKSAAFVFTDDNIISEIEFTSTELYSMYNSIEAEYPSYNKKDQTDLVIVSTPAGERNANEPDNPLSTRFSLVNDRPRAYNLANIDLRQSRFTTVLKFDASYEAIQVDVGDVVKVTNSLYGYSNKLFRVMRVTEKENNEAMLAAEVILLEYDDSVYEHTEIQTDGTVDLSGIPGWWTGIWGNANITIPGNITVTNPQDGTANTVDPGTGFVGPIPYGNIDWTGLTFGGAPGSPSNPLTPAITVPILTPDVPDLDHICIDMMYDIPGGGRGHICNDIAPPAGNTTFQPGTEINVTIPIPDPIPTDPTLPGFPSIPDFNVDFDIWGVGSEGGVVTNHTYVPSFPVFNPGKINLADIQDIVAGFQVDSAPASNVAMVDPTLDPTGTALGNANSIFTPAVVVDAGGIDFGDFSALSSIVPFGGLDANVGATIAFQNTTDVKYQETYLSNNEPTGNVIADVFFGEGIIANFDSAIPPVLKDDFKFEVSPTKGQSAANIAYAAANIAPPTGVQYLPSNITLQPYANNSLTTGTGGRGLKFKGDVIRASKGDSYRDLR